MCTGNPVPHTRERNQERNNPLVHSVLAVCFFKGTSTRRKDRQVGVSTYLALTFGTLLSSQGTDASFETVSLVSLGVSLSVSPTLSDLFRSVSGSFSDSDSPVGGAPSGVSATLEDFPARLKIEPFAREFGTPNRPLRRGIVLK